MIEGTKKVSDLLTDEKVPPWRRDQVPILCAPNGDIVMVVGHRIDRAYGLRGDESRVLRVRVERRSPDPS